MVWAKSSFLFVDLGRHLDPFGQTQRAGTHSLPRRAVRALQQVDRPLVPARGRGCLCLLLPGGSSVVPVWF